MRAAMKPLPTLMKPLQSVDLATGEPAEALVERSDTAAVEALAVVAEASVAFELARAAREKFGGDALGDFVGAYKAYRGADRLATALDRHLALVGFMGAGKTTLGLQVAERLGRRFVDLDHEIERELRQTIPEIFEERGEGEFRVREQEAALEALAERPATVVALGGGAVTSPRIRKALREHALTVLVEVEPDAAWERVRGQGRPLAQDESSFRALYEERRPLYREAADAVAGHAGRRRPGRRGVHVALGSLERLGELVPGEGAVALVADAQVSGIHGMDAQLALGERLASTHTAVGKGRRRPRAALAVPGSRPRRNRRRARRRDDHRPRRASQPPPTCAASTGWLCRRRWSARSTLRSAARRRSTCPRRRTSSARSTGLPERSSTPPCWRRCPRPSG